MIVDRGTLIGTGVVATLGFATAHVYWAVGGTAGVPTGEPITGRPVFVVYDIASAVVLVVAAGIALRLVSAPTPLLTRLTVVGASIALLRGLVGLVQGVATVAGGHGLGPGAGYDVWFAAVGALFLVAGPAGRTRTRSSRPSREVVSTKPRSR